MAFHTFGPGLALDRVTMAPLPAVVAILEDAETGEPVQAFSMDDESLPVLVATNRYGYFGQFKVPDVVRRLRLTFAGLTLEHTAWELIPAALEQAIAARNEAELAKIAAQQAAALVAAPADTVVKTLIQGTSTLTRQALDALYMGKGTLGLATPTADGLMPKADKAKLDAATSAAVESDTIVRRTAAGHIQGRSFYSEAPQATSSTALTRKDYVDGLTATRDLVGAVDLNTYQTDGVYRQGQTANASTANNYPIARAGLLTVRNLTNMTFQEYQVYGDSPDASRKFWRGRYNAIWTPWKEAATVADIAARQISNGIYAVKDYGAKGNGTTDDTTAVQAAMDAIATAGGGTLLFTPGTYKINGTVKLASNAYITGYGAKIKKTTGSGNYCVFVGLAGSATSAVGYGKGANNITLDGLVFEGDLAAGVSINALSLHRSSGVTVRNCQFLQAMQAGHVIDLMACDDVLIESSQFLGIKASSGREYTEAIQADSSMRIGVGWDYSAFPAERFDGTPSKNITVKDCEFGPLKVGSTTYPGPCPFGTHTYTNGTYIEGLRFKNNTVSGIVAINTTAAYYAILHFTGVRDAVIEGNRFEATGELQTAIRFYRGAGGMTLATVGSETPSYTDTNPSVPEDITIQDNVFTGFSNTSTDYHVIEVFGFSAAAPARNISIRGNKFRDNFTAGTVEGTKCPKMFDGNNMRNLNISDNDASRIRIFAAIRGSVNVRINDNSIADTATTPITVDGSDGISMAGNALRGWANPVTFTDCKQVAVSGNAFTEPYATGPLGARAFLTTGGEGFSFTGNTGRCGVTTTASFIRLEGGTTKAVAMGNIGINYGATVSTDTGTTVAHQSGNV